MGMYVPDPDADDSIDANPNAVVIASYLEHEANKDHTRSLMHEIGHLFDVDDHYDETVEEAGLGDNFSDRCLYGTGRFELGEEDGWPICLGCQETIRKNANKYQELSLLMEDLQ